MFNIGDKTDLNQISLTGLRAIAFMGLLIKAPHSLEEIKQAFIEYNIMGKSNSDDILRIDLNTIKLMGCEIERCSPRTNFKYVLTKHPFSLKVPKEEVVVVKKAYNKLKEKVSLDVLLEYDSLFKKIAAHICDNESKEAILGISSLRHYDTDFIKDLILDAKLKRNLVLLYKKPTLKNEILKNIVAQDVVFENDKLHLYCFDLENKKSIVLNIKRITKLISRKFQKSTIDTNIVKIKFLLKEFDPDCLEKNEVVVDAGESGYVIEGEYHNEFLATQRVLSFGSNCIVLGPEKFKNKIIEKIKEMRKTYEH